MRRADQAAMGKPGMRTAPLGTLFHLKSCEDFDQVLGSVSGSEPPVVHDSLVRWDGDLLTSESNIALEGSQQPLDEASRVIQVLAPVPEEAL